MEYIVEIAWLSLWPIVLYAGLKISQRNIAKFEEKLK